MAQQKDKTTRVQRMGNGPRFVADKFKSGRQVVAKWQVPDTAHINELLVDGKLDLKKLGVWIKENAQVGAKVSGVGLLWIMEYLMRLLNVVLVDNVALRAMERGIGNKKTRVAGQGKGSKIYAGLSNAIKKNPAVASYVVYYAMMVGVLIGGRALVQENDKDEPDAPKQEVKIEDKKEDVATEAISTVDSVDLIESTADLQTISPEDAQFAKQALAEYWPEIAVGLTELETYRASPKRHGSESRETNGLGCTWTYTYDSAGRLHRKANALGQTKTRDKAGNYEQCKRHLLYETLPALKQATLNQQNIGAQQAVALVMAGYQRPADMKEIARRISNAQTVQQLADAFSYYPGAETWREGTLKRRWWCAAYAIGVISAEDFLGLPRDAFSKININNVYRNGHFLFGTETIEYALNRARMGEKSSVKTFLSDFDEGKNILAQVSAGQAERTSLDLAVEQQTAQDVQIEGSMKKLNDADKAFAAGKYQQAADLYLAAIETDADNMEAYSSLALAYKKLGDENKSIQYYEKCVQAVKDGNARMNANKALLLDRDVKASSYYNAGLAREEMGKIYQGQGNVALARRNYDLAAKNYKTALENAQMDDLGDARKQTYQKAINRVQQQMQSLPQSGGKKKTAFNSGVQQLRQKNAKRDIFLYGKEFDGNLA